MEKKSESKTYCDNDDVGWLPTCEALQLVLPKTEYPKQSMKKTDAIQIRRILAVAPPTVNIKPPLSAAKTETPITGTRIRSPILKPIQSSVQSLRGDCSFAGAADTVCVLGEDSAFVAGFGGLPCG